MSKQLRLDVAQLTDVGRKRPHNEDNMAYVIPKDDQVMARKGALFIVADGMGGHAAGEVASEIAVDTVSNVYYQDENEDIPLALMNAIKRANALIHQRAAENMLRSGMGTTCVAAVLRGNIAYVANVGDSRAYMIRHGQSRQISQDHSWVEEQVRAGLLTKDQARSHAQRNVITRCLGTQADVEIDVFSEPLEVGDTFILCSDGLSGAVGEDDLRSIVNQYLPQESVYHLVERANENGGPDNITAIVARVQELGEEFAVDARFPVSVGGGQIADETTAVLGRLPSSAQSSGDAHADGRTSSAPSRMRTGPLLSSENLTASKASPAQKQQKRRRLLYPSLAIFIVFLLALAAGGVYFFLQPVDAEAALGTASNLITQAKSNSTSQPERALQNLAKAQDQLRSLKQDNLSTQQSARFSSLQKDLESALKIAMSSYNAKSLITALPCKTPLDPVALKTDIAGFSPINSAVVKNGDHVFSYLLGNDYFIYMLGNNQDLARQTPVNEKVISIANDDQHLYVLTKTNDQAYKLSVFKPNDQGILGPASDTSTASIPIDKIDHLSPQFMSVWSGEIYVLATASQSNQSRADVIKFKMDNDKLDTNFASANTSISSTVVGLAAWPDHRLFLLHSDGHVKSMVFNTPSANESEVLLQTPIATPWPIDVSSFTAATPIATSSAPIQNFLAVPAPTNVSVASVPAQTLLTTGNVNNANHLYIADTVNHRVLDLTPFGGGGVGGTNSSSASVSMQLLRQYASPTVLASIKSIVLNSKASHINVYTQSGKSGGAVHMVPIDVSQPNTCVPAS